ncbi:hypothetical protein J2Y40_001079 [Chryseobacterium sp. 2987]|nr:hypothetical protein [Chryseobacterium sp. 2987]
MENPKFDKEKFNDEVEQIVNLLKGKSYTEIKFLFKYVIIRIKERLFIN